MDNLNTKDADPDYRQGLLGSHMRRAAPTAAAQSASQGADASWRIRDNVHTPVKGLVVVAVEGRNFPKMDFGPFGLCDPYLILKVSGQVNKSGIIKHTLTPVWNETFYFDVANEDTEILVVECYDWDMTSKDDFIGSVEILPKDFHQETSRWYSLQNSSRPDDNTEVLLRITPHRENILDALTVWDRGMPEGDENERVAGTAQASGGRDYVFTEHFGVSLLKAEPPAGLVYTDRVLSTREEFELAI